jgi:hypothetical protein
LVPGQTGGTVAIKGTPMAASVASSSVTPGAAPQGRAHPAAVLAGPFGEDPFGTPFGSDLASTLGSDGANPSVPGEMAAGEATVAATAPAALTTSLAGLIAGPRVTANPPAVTRHSAPSLPLLPPSSPAGPAHHPAAGPRSHSLTFDAAQGPVPVFDCGLILKAPAFVPVNADDDNGSAVTNGIPAQRDFDVAPLPVNDQDLLAASLEIQCSVGGTLTWGLGPPAGTGNINAWMDQKKTQQLQLPATTTPPDQTINFFIEGTHESSVANDVTLFFTFTYVGSPDGSLVTVKAQQQITVTPLINSFTLTPAGGTNGQNIVFTVGMNANSGLWAKATGKNVGVAGDGMVFAANVNDTNLSGDLTFIHNVENVQNGVNVPTKDNNGNLVGFLYGQGGPAASANLVVKDVKAFPLLDVNPGANHPDYDYVDFSILQNDGTTYAIQAGDAPATGNPTGSGFGTGLDLKFTFTMWLFWRYSNTVGGVATSVYYPMAKDNWQVVFQANSSTGSPPIDQIQVLHGITSPNPYTPTNNPPDVMSPIDAQGNLQTWNGNNKWTV